MSWPRLPFALALAACAASDGPELPEGTVVLPGSAVTLMLHQCSRAAPEAGEGTWEPGAEEITALEDALTAALRDQVRRFPVRISVPNGWLRQYVGIVRVGRHFIYGNFFPRDVASEPPYNDNPNRLRAERVMVCDGGPAFFGVEYDVAAGRITHLAFNGMG
jgi:hypothetical protein